MGFADERTKLREPLAGLMSGVAMSSLEEYEQVLRHM